jgi:alanine racemase
VKWKKLEQIILPTIGILTNIGEAHSEGFKSKEEKLSEKLKLFKSADISIVPGDDALITKTLGTYEIKCFYWGKSKNADVKIISIKKVNLRTGITINHKQQTINFSIPFTDDASIENSIACCCALLVLGYENDVIVERMKGLTPVNMRLELKKGY